MASVTKYTDNTGNKSTASANVTATTDKLFIPSAWEVFGTMNNYEGNSMVNTYEHDKQVNGNYVQEQYEYFKSHKIRYKHTDTSTACIYWLRSPTSNNATSFRRVEADGTHGGKTAGFSYGVVPCFVIAAA